MALRKTSLTGGRLASIDECYILTPTRKIDLYILPRISDSRSVNYNDEAIMARSFPLKTYASGGNRSISIEIPFLIIDELADPSRIWNDKIELEACTYPQDGTDQDSAPFAPPPICRLKFGHMLGRNGICAVLRSYNVSYPTDVAWYWGEFKIPFYFTLSTQWEAVYRTTELPGSEKIRLDGS